MVEPSGGSYALKAEEYMKAADKKYKGGFFGKLFGSKDERMEGARDMYKQAATNYKLAKRWEEAANAYIKCVDCEKALKSGEAVDYIVEAANMLKKVNSADAIKLMEEAVELYCQEHRLGYAAKMRKQIAELQETDQEIALASQNQMEAADLFYAEGDNMSEYTKMKLKVADLMPLKAESDFIEAIKIYEEIADKFMENKLTAPSAKELFFKSALLNLENDDTVGCQNAIERYIEKDPSFQNARQCKFVQAILKAVEENNVQKFSDECYEFNQYMPLDRWKTQILNDVKERLGKSKFVDKAGIL